MDGLDISVFTKDYLQYLRILPGYNFIGVDGGEDLLSKDGRPLKDLTQYNLDGNEIRVGLRYRVKSMGRKRPKIN